MEIDHIFNCNTGCFTNERCVPVIAKLNCIVHQKAGILYIFLHISVNLDVQIQEGEKELYVNV